MFSLLAVIQAFKEKQEVKDMRNTRLDNKTKLKRTQKKPPKIQNQTQILTSKQRLYFIGWMNVVSLRKFSFTARHPRHPTLNSKTEDVQAVGSFCHM